MTDLEAVVRAAVLPTAGDIVEARGEVMNTLAEMGTCNRETFAINILRRRGVAPAAQFGEVMQVTRDGDGEQVVDLEDATIVRQRIDFAVREALGQLSAEGLVLQAAGSYHGPDNVHVPAEEKGRWGGGITVEDSAPRWGGDGWNSRWRLTRPADHPLQQLARADVAAGLDELLGVRGIAVLNEAVRCFGRGLYMAAVDLLAAASEAAWFSVAARVTDDVKLVDSVAAGENAADVIHRTSESLGRQKVLNRHVLNDVRAQAARFRDIRNYGLHPTGATRDEHETAFTEAGAALLFMSARPYFLRLKEALDALSTSI